MKSEDIVSNRVARYIHDLKRANRHEVYETMCLLLLNTKYLSSLNKLIENNLMLAKKKVDSLNGKGVLNLEIVSSQAYLESVREVCNSEFFISNFSRSEIRRRQIIGENCVVEIVFAAVAEMIAPSVKVSVKHFAVEYPTIEYKKVSQKVGPDQVTLKFSIDTPLDEVISYLKKTVGLKNNPRKRRLSLGRGIRMLQIERELASNKKSSKNLPSEYVTQQISRLMNERYREKVTLDQVGKALQRTKKIKKLLNTPGDQ